MLIHIDDRLFDTRTAAKIEAGNSPSAKHHANGLPATAAQGDPAERTTYESLQRRLARVLLRVSHLFTARLAILYAQTLHLGLSRHSWWQSRSQGGGRPRACAVWVWLKYWP